MSKARQVIRTTVCFCGQTAEICQDKNGKPYLVCNCGLKIFFKGYSTLAYQGFFDIEAYLTNNLAAYISRAGARVAERERIRRERAMKPSAKPRKKAAKKKSAKTT